jgi:hypothetical protein
MSQNNTDNNEGRVAGLAELEVVTRTHFDLFE